MTNSHTISVAIVLLATIACGPPGVESGPTGEESDSGELGSDTTSTSTTSAETTDTETTDTETTDELSTTADFFPRQDIQKTDQCDPWSQDCPEGEKCVPYSSAGGNWDANKCVPIMGDQEPGEPCWYGGAVEATDNCDETSACWDVMDIDGERIGTCHAFCTGTPDNPECPPASTCLVASEGAINICVPTCDPLLQDCGPGLACYWANTDFNCIFTMQDIPTGDPCGFINDCAIGNVCVPAETLPSCAGAACCTLFCDVNLGDQQCEALPGTSCVPFFEEWQALPGYEHIGVCIAA